MTEELIIDETRPLKQGNFPVVYDTKLVVEGFMVNGYEGLVPDLITTTETHHIGIFLGLDRLRTGLEEYLRVTERSQTLRNTKVSSLNSNIREFDSSYTILSGSTTVDKDTEDGTKKLHLTEKIVVTKRRLY